MKKLFLFAALSVMCVCVSNAQVERNYIYNCMVGELNYEQPKAEEAPKNKTKNVVNQVVGALFAVASGTNVETIDRPEYASAFLQDAVSAVGCCRRFRARDIVYNPEEGAPEGVGYLVDVYISSIKSSTRQRVWTDKNSNKTMTATEHSANVVGSLTIKTIDDGRIVCTHTINSSSWDPAWWNSIDEAVGYTLKNMKYNIINSLNNSYPLYASIVDGERFTEKKAKEVYIDLGSNMGVYKGMHFFVYTVKEIAGKQAKKKIGQLKVTEASSEDISLCKVQSGGADIKKAMDAGETLLIMSKD